MKIKLDFEQRQKAEEMIEQASDDEDILREFIYELVEVRQAAEQVAERQREKDANIVKGRLADMEIADDFADDICRAILAQAEVKK